MVDKNKAFEIEDDGLLLTDPQGVEVLWIGGGSAVPSHDAPIGSRYFRTDTTSYTQDGPGLNNWTLDVFGGGITFVDKADSEGESSTTNTSFVEKLSLTTGVLASGSYRISWYYECSASGADAAILRVEIDNTTEVHYHEEEMESLGDYMAISGFKDETLSGVTDIDLDYRADGAGDTTYVRRARLAIWRLV